MTFPSAPPHIARLPNDPEHRAPARRSQPYHAGVGRLAWPARLMALGAAGWLAGCGGGDTGTTPALLGSTRASAAAVAATPTATATLGVRARGSLAGGIGPMLEVRVDGVVVERREVRNTAYETLNFPLASLAAGTRVDLLYTNDATVAGIDRNLYVESITAGGTTIRADAAGVVYDRGSGAAAVDGLDVRPGQPTMPWNGALRFVLGGGAGTSTLDASRLAGQASFGATEALVTEIRNLGATRWVAAQQALSSSRYTRGAGDAIHKNTSSVEFCAQPANAGANCWRDWYTATPLQWDFYRNAVEQPDQLRQRVAFALQQILVVSDLEVVGTYGLRNYHNALLDNAFGNYRQVLKKVALSPVMGDYLNGVNNDKAAPNENFGRELLQLFSVGTCLLNADGSLKGGACQPTYDNTTVRNYAYALTGWTYPAGGATPWGCWPSGTNCQYYGGDMVPLPAYRDTAERALLSGVTVPAGSTAPVALERVLDSLMAHPNTAPFIGRRLIQHLVSSNPSAGYVQRVAAAFNAGRFSADGMIFGAGQRGDLAATVAAVLLDAEARSATPARSAGKLREPTLVFTGVLRALNGHTDGDALIWWWSELLRQHLFAPPSVFNFYPPDYPVAGTTLVGPAFGIHNANTAMERLNYITYLLYWGGTPAAAGVPAAIGTGIDVSAFLADAGDPAKLVDRLSLLAIGEPLPAEARTTVVSAVASFTSANSSSWQAERVKQAAYLIFGSPYFHIQR